jgi:hypothetical protein
MSHTSISQPQNLEYVRTAKSQRLCCWAPGPITSHSGVGRPLSAPPTILTQARQETGIDGSRDGGLSLRRTQRGE